MKITQSCYGAKPSNFTVAEAIETRIASSHDYYGHRSGDATSREVEVLVSIVSDLCQMLTDKYVLDKHDVEKLLGYGFDIE